MSTSADKQMVDQGNPGKGAGPAPAKGIGRAVSGGVSWMMLNTAVSRSAGLLSQIALGYLLTAEDFGIAAQAIAFGAILQVMRDGGARRVLIQRGQKEYPSLRGVIFWISAIFNLMTAGLMVSLAPVAASYYNEPQVEVMLYIFATVLPLSTFSSMLSAKLAIDLRFRSIAIVRAMSATLRATLIVVFALLGFGPLSFVLPMPIVAIFDGICFYILVREHPWKLSPQFSRWPVLLKSTGWVILGTLATAAYNQGDYIVLGSIVATGVLGVYYFAYQLSKQVIILLMYNLQVVLMPALSRLNDEPERQRAAALKAARILMLLAAPTSLAIVCIIHPLEDFLWRGRWAEAVLPVMVLGAVLPLNILSVIPKTLVISTGRFRLWSCLMLIDAAGVMTAAGIGGYLTTDRAGLEFFDGEALDPFGIALAIGLYNCFSVTILSRIALRSVGLRLRQLLVSTAPAYAITIAVSIVVVALDRTVFSGLTSLDQLFLAAWLFGGSLLVFLPIALHDDVGTLIDIIPGPLRPLAAATARRRPGGGAEFRALKSKRKKGAAPSGLDDLD